MCFNDDIMDGHIIITTEGVNPIDKLEMETKQNSSLSKHEDLPPFLLRGPQGA